jgi:hypothetical protein
VLTRISRYTSRNNAAVAVGGQSPSVELKPGKGHRPEWCREEAFFDNLLLRDTGLESKLPGVSVLTDGSATALRQAWGR